MENNVEFENAQAPQYSAPPAAENGPKKFDMKIVIAGVAVVAVVAILLLVLGSGNSYMTPVEIAEDYANEREYTDPIEEQLALFNGFAEDELETIYDLYSETDDYADNVEDAKDRFEEQIQDMIDEYGEDYSFSYIVYDEEELEREDIREFREKLRSRAESLKELVDSTDDYDSDDWEDLAEELGFDGNKTKAKELVEAIDELRQVYKTAEVTEGYKLWVTIEITGSELDEPEEIEEEICVFKVDGNWVPEDIRYNPLPW